MKAISAYYLCHRKGLIRGIRFRDFKWLRSHVWTECRSWEEFVRALMLVRYIVNCPGEELRIPEVGMSIGGTIKLRL